ncbi:MAG TPA: hypothetical protein VN837_01265 [Chloroflexota bacterium]|nr:hypothetical protein [Chloroflexota bacterium]
MGSKAPSAAPPTLGHILRILIGVHARMLFRPSARRGTISGRAGNRGWIRYLILLAVIVFLAVVVTGRLVDVVGGPIGRALLGPMLTFASSAASVALFLFAIPTVMAALTYKSDLKLLLLTPVSPRVLLAEKFGSIYCQLSAFVLLIGIPILLGIGRALNLGPGYGLVTILVLLLLPIAPLSLALMVLIAVLRWLPPRWARTLTAVLGTVFGLIGYIGTQLLTNGGGAGKTAHLRGLFAQAPSAWWQSLPMTWPGQAMAAAAHGHAGTAITYLAGSAALAFGLAVTAILLAAHLFSTGWATYQEVGSRRKTQRSGERAAALTLPGPLRLPASPGSAGTEVRTTGWATSAQEGSLPLRLVWRSLWRKDWLGMRRDPQLLARLAYPLVIVGFGFYRTSSKGVGGASAHGVGMVSVFITMSIYVFLLSNFVAPRLVNREGKSLYLLALAPVSSHDVLLVKWALGALPIAGLTAVFAIVGALLLHLAIWSALLSLGAFGSLAIAMVGALLTLSLIWPRLDWDNPSRQVSMQAALFGTVGGLIMCAGICALLAVAIGWSSSHPTTALLAGVGIFVITLAVCWISLIVGSWAMKILLGGAS